MYIAMALRWFLYALAALIIIECGVVAVAWPSMHRFEEKLPHKEVALVLGASIHGNGDFSPVLEERADAALALYRAGIVKKILVSGDSSTPHHDEVYPVGTYLMAQGVPQSDIFLDYAGLDTYSSIYRAKHAFGVSSLIIASQYFHLPRALLIARALGVDAVGYDVRETNNLYLQNTLRELPATDKAILDIMMRRVPTQLSSTTQMLYSEHAGQ